MAALSRLQSLTNNTSLQNLIHRHLLRHVATPHPFNISPESQPLMHFDSQNVKSCLAGHFSDEKKLNSNANEFVLNLRTFDLSMMELRGSRSSSSKNRPYLDEDIEEDDDDDFDDVDDDDDDDDDVDDVYGSGSDDDDDDDDNGRRGGGSRGGGAYTV